MSSPVNKALLSLIQIVTHTIRPCTLISLFAVTLCLAASPAYADFKVCNKTLKSIDVALQLLEDNDWSTNGWFKYEPGECGTLVTNTTKRHYYIYVERSDGVKWEGVGNNPFGCIRDEKFDIRGNSCGSGYRRVQFLSVKMGEPGESRTVNITLDGEHYQEVEVGQIHQQCLARWHDSHQVHSVDTIVKWNYQAVKTTMKKLEHCIELKVTGPVEIEGVARDYVNNCVNHGLNHQKTRHALGLLIAIGADVLGAGGAATAAKVTDYITSASNETVDCLTNTGRISDFLEKNLHDKFNASVNGTSHWVYWEL